MPMDFIGSTPFCRVWLSGILGYVRVDMSRVGLKLALGVKSLSLDVLIFLTATHRHNELFQPGGSLYIYLNISKHASAARYPSFLQWGHKVGSLFPCPPVLLRREVSLSRLLILVENVFTIATNYSLVVASLVLFATSCSRTDF